MHLRILIVINIVLDTIGRDSPSALLVVLAEVASQTLHSETKHIDSLLAAQCKPRTASIKRKESCFTVSQLLSMPVSHLVKQFAIFTSDELKRQYSYTCALVPGCQQKYTSFASEEKARASIKSHLEEHLEYLKADKETCMYFNELIVLFISKCCIAFLHVYIYFSTWNSCNRVFV